MDARQAKRRKTMECLTSFVVLTGVLCLHVSPAESKVPTNGGFFPGHCGQMSPCSQVCEDLPDKNSFVCSCKDGYQLHENGFSCLEKVPNPATTIRPELYDLDASERETIQGQDVDENDLELPESPEEQDLADISRLTDDVESQSLEELAEDSEDEMVDNEPLELNEEREEPETADKLDDEMDLNALTKRARNADRERNRNRKPSKARLRDGSGRKNKDKNRKGKGRKGKGNKEKYYVNLDKPLNDVYVKEGKPSKDKTAIENEIETVNRHMTCFDLMCKGSGKCVPDDMRAGGGVRCQCPLGKEGEFCENDIAVQFPKFMGTGYMAFPILRGSYRDMSVTIEFKPDTHNGLLLYSGDFPHPMSDFFSVALVDGHVEFRFDCGTGMAQIATDNSINLGDWNTITIKRSDWYGWVQLNDGAQERGRSQGLFSRITFREDLYLGGYKNTSQLGSKTGMQWGFVGCVRYLAINDKVYDMRQGAFVGDAIHGMDVGECSSSVCDSVKCMNGGTCVAESADSSICLCPLGTAGDRCESRIDIHVPLFSGQSYLKFLGLGQSALSILEGEIVFKATDPNGLLLYNGYATDRTGDFLSLALANGFVDFRFDLGTGPAVIRSRDPVSMNQWHVVKFQRTGRNGELTVDNQAPVTGLSKGGYTQLTLTLDLFVGGHRNFDEVAKKAQVRTAFKGCIQKVVVSERALKLMEEAIGGVNIDNCDHPCKNQPCLNGGRCVPIKDYYRCSCPVGFQNNRCEDTAPPMTPVEPGIVRYRYRYRYRRDIREPITVPTFSGTSYLRYQEDPREQLQYRDPDREMRIRLNGATSEIDMRFKTNVPDGVLLWVGDEVISPTSNHMSLGLKDGHVEFIYNLGSGEAVITNTEVRVDDDKWHKIRAQRYRKVGYLEVDSTNAVEGTSPGYLEQFYVQGPIYIGGLPDAETMTDHRYKTGFTGCITNTTLSRDYHVELPEFQDDMVHIQQCDDTH